MTKAAIKDSIYWLNVFTSDNRLSNTLSPDEWEQVLPNPNYDKLTIDFWSYAQLHTCTNNTTKSRMVGAISLRSAGERNRYYLVSLATGKKFHAFNLT